MFVPLEIRQTKWSWKLQFNLIDLSDPRWRIESAQLISEEDISKLTPKLSLQSNQLMILVKLNQLNLN